MMTLRKEKKKAPGHGILISPVDSSTSLWLYSHTLVSSHTFNCRPARRKHYLGRWQLSIQPRGRWEDSRKNSFHLPSDFHSISASLRPPLFLNRTFWRLQKRPSADTHLSGAIPQDLATVHQLARLCFPPPFQFSPIISLLIHFWVSRGETARESFWHLTPWNKFQDNSLTLLILCLRVLVECFGCVHRQSHKSAFSRGSLAGLLTAGLGWG